MLSADCFLTSAARGSILRLSTGLVIRNLLSRPEDLGYSRLADLSQPCAQLFHIRLGPADDTRLDLSFRNQENRWHIGKAIGVGNRVLARWVEQNGERHAMVSSKTFGIGCIILRDAHEGERVTLAVRLENPFQIRKSQLAYRTTHFEECGNNRAAL